MGMYQISVEQHFDAAHYLRGYQGKCESLHGHRFRVVVKVTASRVDDVGMAYDFTELKRHLGDILSRFDHTCLNDASPFDNINPSSENITRHFSTPEEIEWFDEHTLLVVRKAEGTP